MRCAVGIVGAAAVVYLCQEGVDGEWVYGREQLLDVSREQFVQWYLCCE